MKIIKRCLKEWEATTTKLVSLFSKKHFPDYDWRFVGDTIGDVIDFNGEIFLHLDDVIEFIRQDYTTDEIHEYYWYRDELRIEKYDESCKEGLDPKPIINIKNWKKWN